MSKMQTPQSAISPTRSENYGEWYQQVIRGADLAEAAPVRGCMILKPWGCALWERVQESLNRRIRRSGHQNAYFPLLIPLHLIEKEAAHVEGFAKECAVITHHRLKEGPNGLVPDGILEEPLVVRPTSETLIGEVFSRWVQSYRDLPLKINQWANVVRWELRPRLFLRTCEFLWQEGHTVHGDAEEALAQARDSAELYERFFNEVLALPTFAGEKSESERFPGAERTFTLEAMMQDGKALQLGTSHYLGQNFARSANIAFAPRKGTPQLAFTTSWGASTRMIGGVIMTHSDDDGLVLPPAISPIHLVILPVFHRTANRDEVLNYCQRLKGELGSSQTCERDVEIEIDAREERGGAKLWSWIRKGVPLLVEVGPRDVAADQVILKRRDQPRAEGVPVPRARLAELVVEVLENMQRALGKRAEEFSKRHLHEVTSMAQLSELFAERSSNGAVAGFALGHWCGDPAIEKRLAEELKLTIRCLPFSERDRPGTCLFTGKPSAQRVVMARAY